MRVKAVPENLGAIWFARTIMAATKLGVFEALAGGPLGAAAIAARCGTHPAAKAKLLGVVAAVKAA